MNATKLLLSSAVLGLAFFTGCDEGTTPSAVADKAAETAKEGAAAVKDATNTAADKAGELKDKAGELAAEAAELVKDPKAAFDKLQGFIDSKNWNDAKGLLDKLSAVKDKLPAEWVAKLEEFAKKIAEGLKSVGGN